MKSILALALTLTAAVPLSAQVGYEPRKSPFRDLERTMELTVFTGTYSAKRDPARVAPESGPMMGVHYQWRAGGPASITATLARVSSERRVLDPLRDGTCGPAASPNVDCKLVSVFRWPLYFADAGVSLDLTGARSFYNFVPDLKAGIGLVSDFHTQPDVGEFAFGTRFAMKWGGGIRWIPSDLFQIRADVTNYLYTVRYPDFYKRPAEDDTQIIAPTQKSSVWLNNTGFTIGLSYLFSR